MKLVYSGRATVLPLLTTYNHPVAQGDVKRRKTRQGSVKTNQFTIILYSHPSIARSFATATLMSFPTNARSTPSIHPKFRSTSSPTSTFITIFTYLTSPILTICPKHLGTRESTLSSNFFTVPVIIRTVSLLIMSLSDTQGPIIQPSLCCYTHCPSARYTLQFTQHFAVFLHSRLHLRFH